MNDVALKVNFTLRRRAEPSPAVAVLLPALDAGELVRLCAPLCQPKWPEVFDVAGGFLVKLPEPSTRPFPGAIRLRSLAANLYLPVDAELCPPLLDDEASALTSQRGLVFLPGARALSFAPDEALPVGHFVTAGPVLRPDCRPLPQPPVLAERLTAIVFEGHFDDAPERIVEAGGEGIGTESPDQPGPGIGSQLLGGIAAGIGGALAGLGKLLPIPGIASLGANLLERGLNLAPKISSAFLGRQEAALRALLRQFREGNIEEALKRALPMSDEPGRGARVGTGWQLPFHNVLFSLTDLLGGGRGRPASIWYGGLNVQDELRKEYRRQAELATQRGDYRRAAFIYAKLLGDFRPAANVLAQGGLYRDAAIIYLKKLDDKKGAARAFEKAGDFDRALEIYRSERWHEAAGDLLRRMGEEDLAVVEYQRAAQLLIDTNNDYYQAGELLAQRARRQDLALAIYQTGWRNRLANQALPCARRLLEMRAQREEFQELRGLASEATGFLRQGSSDTEAAGFLNELATLAERKNLASVRDELRDLALCGLATRLRTDPSAVGRLFKQADVWTSSLISDAEFAIRAARKRTSAPLRPVTSVLPCAVLQGRIPTVTAVHFAPDAAGLYVGFASGEVAHYDVARGAINALSGHPSSIIVSAHHSMVSSASEPLSEQRVHSLATDAEGAILVVLHTDLNRQQATLSSYVRSTLREKRPVTPQGALWLAPHVAKHGDWNVLLANGPDATLLCTVSLLPIAHFRLPRASAEAACGLLVRSVRPTSGITRAMLFQQAELWICPLENGEEAPTRNALGWTPEVSEGCPLLQPPFAWLPVGADEVELVGLTRKGMLRWSRIKIRNDSIIELVATRYHCSPSAGYRAATLIREGLAAAVREDAIEWLHLTSTGYRVIATTAESFAGAVACYPFHAGQELVVVCGNGSVYRTGFAR